MRVPVRPVRPDDPRQPAYGPDDGRDSGDDSDGDDPPARVLLPQVHTLTDLGAGPSLAEHDYVANLPPECIIARAEIDPETRKSCSADGTPLRITGRVCVLFHMRERKAPV
jgi:hypothetical protein